MQLRINASSFENNSSHFGKCGSMTVWCWFGAIVMKYENYFDFCVQFWSLNLIWIKPKRTKF